MNNLTFTLLTALLSAPLATLHAEEAVKPWTLAERSGRACLLTPAGKPFLVLGISHVGKGSSQTERELRGWGFNTVRGISLYGIGPELQDWFGKWPKHRSWRDVFDDGAEVYSEFTVPQTLAPAAAVYATLYALEKQAGTIPPGSKPDPLER
jgi:hypothetical protein